MVQTLYFYEPAEKIEIEILKGAPVVIGTKSGIILEPPALEGSMEKFQFPFGIEKTRYSPGGAPISEIVTLIQLHNTVSYKMKPVWRAIFLQLKHEAATYNETESLPEMVEFLNRHNLYSIRVMAQRVQEFDTGERLKPFFSRLS